MLTALLALAVLVPASFVLHDPGFHDAYYYFHVAANLALGRGFTEDFIWSYLSDPPAITHASNLYWMPLVSVIAAPFLAFFGPAFRAAQLPLVFISAFVPAATALVAWRCYGARALLPVPAALGAWFKPLAAAALVLFGGYYFVYWTAVDAFGIYALAAGTSFLATSRLINGPSPLSAAALGVSCAIAHLARADGVLLLLTNLGLLAASSRRPKTVVVPVVAYLLVMTPWFLRNIAIAGTPLPGAGLQTIFLREYNEVFAYGLTLDLGYYLGQGPGELLAGKAAAALRNLGVLFGLQYWLVPFAVIGWRAALMSPRTNPVNRGQGLETRNSRLETSLFLPPLVYGIALYLVMTLVFTFPSGRGTMLHSSVALLPWLAIAAVDGIERTAHWVARRRTHWQPARAFRNFTAIFVAFAIGISLYALVDSGRAWSRQADAYREIAPFILGDRQDAIPMVLNPPGWWYATGRPAIQTPSNGPEAALATARRYGATHLVVEPAVPKGWELFVSSPQNDARFELVVESGAYVVYRLKHLRLVVNPSSPGS